MNAIGKTINWVGRMAGGYRLGLLAAAVMFHLVSASALAQRPSSPPRDAGSLFTWVVVAGVAELVKYRNHRLNSTSDYI